MTGGALIALLALIAFLIAVGIGMRNSIRSHLDGVEEWNREFPTISDDEFLALCKPGTNRDVALRVRRMIADSLGVEYDRIHPSMRFDEDMGVC